MTSDKLYMSWLCSPFSLAHFSRDSGSLKSLLSQLSLEESFGTAGCPVAYRESMMVVATFC